MIAFRPGTTCYRAARGAVSDTKADVAVGNCVDACGGACVAVTSRCTEWMKRMAG